MRIAIVTDAWHPQINGVVTTLTHTGDELRALGHDVFYLTPEAFRTLPCPTYASVRLAVFPGRGVTRMLDVFRPDAIHIATEGPLGLAARRYCRLRDLKFTTSYHTRFPQYVRLRAPIPLAWSYLYLRWFHGAAARTLVSTHRLNRELQARGLKNIALWPRGVDSDLFRPRDNADNEKILPGPRPIVMYLGRVAVEKNIEDFLRLDLPGTKCVIGEGPDLKRLTRRYPQVRFTGVKRGEELARQLACADVLVFPSRTDTLGLVMLEALACGVPVAAYPVAGPLDVVKHGETGILDEDLGLAVREALKLDRQACRDDALARSWRACTEGFVQHLEVKRARRRAHTGPVSGLTVRGESIHPHEIADQ